MMRTPEEWVPIDVQIVELNAAGFTDMDIARTLKLTPGQAAYRRDKLGLVSPYSGKDAKGSHAAGLAGGIAIQQRFENAIPMGRGGDAAFARLIGDRRFQDVRLKASAGYLPAPLPRPASGHSAIGSTAAMCAETRS